MGSKINMRMFIIIFAMIAFMYGLNGEEEEERGPECSLGFATGCKDKGEPDGQCDTPGKNCSDGSVCEKDVKANKNFCYRFKRDKPGHRCIQNDEKYGTCEGANMECMTPDKSKDGLDEEGRCVCSLMNMNNDTILIDLTADGGPFCITLPDYQKKFPDTTNSTWCSDAMPLVRARFFVCTAATLLVTYYWLFASNN